MTTAPVDSGDQDRREAERARFRAAFEAIPPGASYSWRRTFTEGDVTAFCGVTGDFNPYHLDAEFAAQSRFGRRIVPGLSPPRCAPTSGACWACSRRRCGSSTWGRSSSVTP